MKCPVLLWLFLPMMQSFSVPDHSGNVTLEPATTLGTSKQRDESVLSSTMIPLDNESTDPILDSFDYDFEVEDLDTPETHYIRIFLKEQSGLKNITKRISDEVWMSQRPFHFLKAVNGLFVENINCVLFASQLNCTWKILNPPIDAQYSVTIQQEDSTTTCYCDQKDGKVIGCHGIFEQEQVSNTLININVSCSNFSYIHSWVYDKSLEKLQPPQNISASINSGKLHIKWDPPQKLPKDCFCYELKIKEGDYKTVELSEEVEHIVPDIDLTKSYSVQMRVKKTNSCFDNYIWSDWSTPVVVPPSKKPFELSAAVIAAIALGIPMFLLAVLLLFRGNRIFEKLFPVPSPPIKIKQLLEKDDFIQVAPSKNTEEITDVLLISNDECMKISF